MNTEVTAVVENKAEEKGSENKAESCTECVFVELGQVSKDTQGGAFGGSDGGIGKRV